MNRLANIVGKARRLMLLAPALLLAASGAVCPRASAAGRMPTQELNRLNEVMRDAARYRASKEQHLDSLKRQALRATDARVRFARYLSVGEAYRTFMADSALKYCVLAEQQARRSGDPGLVHRADIAMIGSMSVAGFFAEASVRLDSLKFLPLPLDQKVQLWLSARQLYSSMITYVGEETPFVRPYQDRDLAIDDSLLRHLPRDGADYRFIYAERLVSSGRYSEARPLLERLLASTQVSDNIHGKAAYQLAMLYRHQGDERLYAAYLAKAATSDITGCVTEGWALPKLAEWLYQNDRLDQAFTYINFSLSEAKSGNARTRSAVISGMMPTIDDAYRKSLTQSRDRLVVFLCLATFLFLLAAALTAVLLRQIRRAHEAQRKLKENSRLQEFYIGNFVGLCSSYSSKLQSWQKMVTRKLALGQTDDLLKTLKAGKISGENEDFHSAIDTAFLQLYPHFIEEINTLLRTDEQVHLNKNGGLPPELRILALIRLGVEESSRIASILQYSPNTVYAYRNKMRNKALSRDDFERQVRHIGYEE